MSNKIALVTGGSRGLGRDMALSLAKKKIDVIITYYSKQAEAEVVVSELESLGVKAASLYFSAGDVAACDGFISNVKTTLSSKWETDKIDFLINNAGMGATIPIAQMTEAIFDDFVNVHFKGTYFLTQKMMPMINDHGQVIFISSGSTRVVIPGYSVYAACKAAIENLAKSVAKEYGARGIRANVVAPGPIETDFNNAAIKTSPERKAMISTMSPLGRVGQADDIGGVISFLCSDDAKWINGQRIEVSGGMNL